jgi:two-component system cell cycle sensor histidine kinase/response regulator CckA
MCPAALSRARLHAAPVVSIRCVYPPLSNPGRPWIELGVADGVFQALMEACPDGIVFVDESGRIMAVNTEAEAIFGYGRNDLVGESVEVLVPDRVRAQHAGQRASFVQAPVVRAMGHRGEFFGLRKDGTEVLVEISLAAHEEQGRQVAIAIVRDVSAREAVELQLRQTQKMDAIGSLAAGIAHDFNNVLLVIRGLSGLLLQKMSDGELRESVFRIDQAAEHAAELTRQLLAFSRQQVLRPQVTDLSTVVEEALALLTRTIGENIEVRCETNPALKPVLIDRSQLKQVIFNLAVNARDAMEKGGTLTIRTSNVDLGESFAAAHPGISAGPHVLLQITDSGHGMDAQTLTRIFDPFFTTKAEGTGLGLATVYGIVRQSGGYIWPYSEPGLGTTFKIYLPSTAATGGSAGEPPEPEPASLDGSETILLVEDEEIVRTLASELLQFYGYTVHAAASGADALLIPGHELRSFDLLMTDIVMPGMNGYELAHQLAAKHPGLKVLFTSGYPKDSTIRDDIGTGHVHFLEKPYTHDQLARKIKTILAKPPPPTQQR